MDISAMDARIALLTAAARAYKSATGLTASTAELGELHACRLMNLAKAITDNPGSDATDPEGRRVQVKARAPRTGAHVDPQGRMGRIANGNFDYLLLVLLDGEFVPESIWRAERAEAEALQLRDGNAQSGPHVSTFLKHSRRVWARS
jgi:hypothetical protein